MSLTPYPLPRPTRLCVVRHGETNWNTGKRVQGQIDIWTLLSWAERDHLAGSLDEL